MTTTTTRRDAMPDSVMLTKPHHMTYTLTLLLLLMLLASTHSRHDDRNSLLANVDTESSDDELAARDQARVSDTHTQQQQQQPAGRHHYHCHCTQ